MSVIEEIELELAEIERAEEARQKLDGRVFPTFKSWFKASGGCEFGWDTDVLPEPTSAQPGSPEKIEVLKARYENGEMLHHPDDPFLCE